MERSVGYQMETSEYRQVPIERDIQALVEGLALLGIKRCSQCGQFFRASDSGALFDAGDLVCYGCIREWWSARSPEFAIDERQRLESKLAAWLRKCHQAQVIKDPAKAPAPQQCEIQLTAGCVECGGSGKLLEGERCRFCNGLGTVFIVVLKDAGRVAA
jgi:hypothetical protein